MMFLLQTLSQIQEFKFTIQIFINNFLELTNIINIQKYKK
jgi:hypothetical protein